MARFSYKGRERNGALTEGELDANDATSAAAMLRACSVTPIAIAPLSAKKESVVSGWQGWFVPEVTLDDLVIFCRQMYSLTKAGIPLLKAVSGLAESCNSIRLKLALEDAIVSLERGRTLSSGLNQHPKIVNQLFVSIIHVGENTGQLEDAFAQLAVYLEREQEPRKQIKAASRYPIFVLIALAGAFVVLNIFVIPKFADMFSKFNAELPLMTRALIGTSDFLLNYWYMLIAGGIFIAYMIRRSLSTNVGRLNWDRRKLSLPIVGSIFNRSLLSRYCRSFSMMLRAGVPLTSALNLTSDAVGNVYMGQKIIGMRERIEKGEGLARVSAASGLFTPLVMQMIRVGEETGRVDELLVEASEFYEREVDYDLKNLTAKIEPFLIVVVAAMVLVLALGIFTPMWDMMNAIKGV